MRICCICIVTAGLRRNIRSFWGVCKGLMKNALKPLLSDRIVTGGGSVTCQWEEGQSEPGFTCSFHESATGGRDSKLITRSVHVALPPLTKS